MPTPNAYGDLWGRYTELRRTAFALLMEPNDATKHEKLWDLVGDYSPDEDPTTPQEE